MDELLKSNEHNKKMSETVEVSYLTPEKVKATITIRDLH